jgi:arsenate reductase
MLHITGIKNCDTIRKTLKWLDKREQPYVFRDVKKDPLSAEELDDLIGRAGLYTLVNKRGMKWRSLGLAKQDLSDQEMAETLLEHQTMIKRPVVEAEGSKAVQVGFDEDALDDFIKEYV